MVEISRLVDDDDDDISCAGVDVLFDFPLGSWTSNGEDRRDVSRSRQHPMC